MYPHQQGWSIRGYYRLISNVISEMHEYFGVRDSRSLKTSQYKWVHTDCGSSAAMLFVPAAMQFDRHWESSPFVVCCHGTWNDTNLSRGRTRQFINVTAFKKKSAVGFLIKPPVLCRLKVLYNQIIFAQNCEVTSCNECRFDYFSLQ